MVMIALKNQVPLTIKPRQQALNVRLSVLLSFAAGILIGIPLTLCAVFFGSLHQAPLPPVDEKFYGEFQEALPARGDYQTIHGASTIRLGHPAESLLTKIRKSGLGISKATVPPRYPRLRGKERKTIPHHVSDFYADMAENENMFYAVQNTPNDSLKLEDMIDGIFWNESAEKLVPKGFTEHEIHQWHKFLNITEVLKVEEGCGRMQNRLVTLAEGGKSCCRYRHNDDQIQGEIFSFYLGRILEIDNLSPSALALVDPRTRRWSAAASQMALARWSPERPAVLTRFIENLQPAFIPKHLRNSTTRRLHPVIEDLQNLTKNEISELVQWSDLIIFDYLTGNLDRVVNNMYNERWNPGMMSQPTHNLAKTPEGLLLFLDNESGLLHGYRLLEKYELFHRSLLDAICVFRKKTVRVIQRLHKENNIEILLKQAFVTSDPGMSEWLPFLPERSVRTLKERIAQVLQQVKTCRSRFVPYQSDNLIDR